CQYMSSQKRINAHTVSQFTVTKKYTLSKSKEFQNLARNPESTSSEDEKYENIQAITYSKYIYQTRNGCTRNCYRKDNKESSTVFNCHRIDDRGKSQVQKGRGGRIQQRRSPSIDKRTYGV
ncbi:hypothetical protein L9F63_025961, partial [Diploptera punctata]